jgi:hypothetical protein
MIGTLTKLKDGWYVKFFEDGTVIHTYLPLHPEDENLSYAVRDSAWDGKKVNFEVVVEKETSEYYAKLIPSKEQQKQLITEIMHLDAKDGLYEETSHRDNPRPDDVEKFEQDAWDNYEHVEGNLYSTTFRNAFKLGYNKAKEILYTDEDMIRMAIHCWSIASKPEYGKTYNVNEIVKNYIQSLKQPKKD